MQQIIPGKRNYNSFKKRMRDEHNLSVRQIAEMAGVHRHFVRRVLTGEAKSQRVLDVINNEVLSEYPLSEN